MRNVISLLAFGLLIGAAQAQPATYELDAAKSEVVVFVYKDGVAARLAHDHVIAAKDFAGTIVHDPGDLKAFKASVTVQAASLTADDPALAKKHKLPSSPSAADRASIEDTLKGADQLDVKQYPTITFVSSGLRKVKDDLYLSGEFTLHGVKQQVSFLVTLSQEEGVLRGKGSFRIKQSAFGYQPYSAFLGAVKVKDAAMVLVDLVAKRKEEGKK